MALKILISHSLRIKVALLPRVIGNHGRIVQKHVVLVFEQEQGLALMILEVQAICQSLRRKIAGETLVLAPTTGRSGVTLTNAPIMVLVHTNKNVTGLCVTGTEDHFVSIQKRKTVQKPDHGELVSLK